MTAAATPRDPATLLEEALALHQSGDLAGAAAGYRAVLALAPREFTALHQLGVLGNQQGDFQAALEPFGQALRVHPRSALAHGNLGYALGRLGRGEEALAHFRMALAFQPNNPEALLNQAEVLMDLGRPEEALAAYARALPLVAEPQYLNQAINTLERELGKDELVSFPPQVFLNFNKLCNAGCLFCHMPEVTSGFRDAVTPEDLARMTWLRYVRELGLFGGFGETLINPRFRDNLAHLRSAHPHLALTLWTNGLALTEELLPVLAEGLASLNVSLNAATAATWERIMGGAKGFERICLRLKQLAELKARTGRTLPRVSLSIVLLQDTAHELPALVDLAAELGAEEVVVQHYSTHEPTTGRSKAQASASMYGDRERCDQLLAEASARAQALGVLTSFPLPFSTPGQAIEAGSRVVHAPGPCGLPWTSLLLFDEVEPGLRQAGVCCTGPFHLAGYRKEDLTEAGLRALWNHPNLRTLRRTTLEGKPNPVCGWCQTTDRFDPADARWVGVREAVEPVFRRWDDAYRSGEPVALAAVRAELEGLPG